MRVDMTHESKRPRVLLKTQALWDRLALMGCSQSWLAREVGISHSYLSTLVNSGRAPSGRIRRRMLRALEMKGFHELFVLRRRKDEV